MSCCDDEGQLGRMTPGYMPPEYGGGFPVFQMPQDPGPYDGGGTGGGVTVTGPATPVTAPASPQTAVTDQTTLPAANAPAPSIWEEPVTVETALLIGGGILAVIALSAVFKR